MLNTVIFICIRDYFFWQRKGRCLNNVLATSYLDFFGFYVLFKSFTKHIGHFHRLQSGLIFVHMIFNALYCKCIWQNYAKIFCSSKRCSLKSGPQQAKISPCNLVFRSLLGFALSSYISPSIKRLPVIAKYLKTHLKTCNQLHYLLNVS